jgi:hypothetical protein
VTPIQSNPSEMEILYPELFDLELFVSRPSFEPFSDEVIAFLNELSKELNKKESRIFPEVATFSFFCRKANLLYLKEKYYNNTDFRLGRGIVFHIAPSNVPVNFAYSLISGMLAGNNNIVRVPSKNFEQVSIIIEALKNINYACKHKAVAESIVLVRYDKKSHATSLLSEHIDVRVIWGGDSTINEIRKSPIPARAFDVTFADRYSFCIVNADAYLEEKEPSLVAKKFYNDTYLMDQNACTSPHLIVWLGKEQNVLNAKSMFWGSLQNEIESRKVEILPVSAIDKLTNMYSQAIGMKNIIKTPTKNNILWRVSIPHLSAKINQYQCSNGYFSEYHAKSLSELASIVNRKYQTVSYYGFSKSELHNMMSELRPVGIDRFVPIGQTLDYSLVWDGYDLMSTLSRRYEIH